MRLYDGGQQTRCFTYVKDAIGAIHKLVDREDVYGEVFNIGANRESTMEEVFEIIKTLRKGDVSIESVDTQKLYGASYQDIERRVPEVSKIFNIIGWKASTSLEQGLKTTIDGLKNAM